MFGKHAPQIHKRRSGKWISQKQCRGQDLVKFIHCGVKVLRTQCDDEEHKKNHFMLEKYFTMAFETCTTHCFTGKEWRLNYSWYVFFLISLNYSSACWDQKCKELVTAYWRWSFTGSNSNFSRANKVRSWFLWLLNVIGYFQCPFVCPFVCLQQRILLAISYFFAPAAHVQVNPSWRVKLV